MLKNKERNWILYLAAFICCLVVIYQIWFSNIGISTRTKTFGFRSIYEFAFSAVILAPLIEELTFRSFFVKMKRMQILGVILLFLFVIQKGFWYNYLLVGVLLILYYWYNKTKVDKLFGLIVILNALVFAILHYDVKDFTNIATTFNFLAQFSFGLLAVWLVVNFSLKHSIIVHCVFNGMIVLLVVFSLSNLDKTKQVYESELVIVNWERTSSLNSKDIEVNFSKAKITARNCKASNLFTLIKNTEASIEAIPQQEPFVKYNIEIKLKDSTKGSIKEEALSFLKKELLVKR